MKPLTCPGGERWWMRQRDRFWLFQSHPDLFGWMKVHVLKQGFTSLSLCELFALSFLPQYSPRPFSSSACAAVIASSDYQTAYHDFYMKRLRSSSGLPLRELSPVCVTSAATLSLTFSAPCHSYRARAYLPASCGRARDITNILYIDMEPRTAIYISLNEPGDRPYTVCSLSIQKSLSAGSKESILFCFNIAHFKL